jgi:uncharacterized protein YcnI
VFVSVAPKPGWTVATTTRTLDEPFEAFGTEYTEAVDTITWTADDGVQIEPGQFDWFWVSVGPLPSDVDELGFPALQTYSSGEVVRWIEPMNADGSEPELPMPTVALVAATGDSAEAAPVDDSDDGTDALTIVALVAGIAGLLVGGAALVLARRRQTT